MESGARKSDVLERYTLGRVRCVAQLLGVPAVDLQAEVVSMAREGVDTEVALDWLVLQSVR